MNQKELLERYETVKYILEISYSQLQRYDEKTNQLLTLIGLDFTVLGFFSTLFLQGATNLPFVAKILYLVFVLVDMTMIIISLFVVKSTLSPHLKPVDKRPKSKRGLLFFSDIEIAFTEDEYVDIMSGKKPLKPSNRYDSNDENAFLKCMIEDCSYDIYEQAKILNMKSKFIKRAYRIVIFVTTLTIVTVVTFSAWAFFN